MDFNKSLNYINEKVAEFSLPYFKCVVTKDKKIILNKRFSIFNDGNDLLKMYSMSKPITVVALMQLVERGLVSIEDNVSKYLNGYDNLRIYNTNQMVNKPLTIHHLLTMTSGLDYNRNRVAICDCLANNPKASTIELASTFAKDGILFEPGSLFNYSLSIDVIAAIIEIVSKQKFSDYVEENIFRPLGMKNSTFKNDRKLANVAVPDFIYSGEKLEKTTGNYEYFTINDKYESGGAGLISTVEDYSLFLTSLANDEKLLKRETIDKIASVYVENTPFNKDVSEYSKSSEEYGYGYGVRVRKHISEYGIPEGEFGWDGAAGSYSLCDRKNKITITIGLNIMGWPRYVKDFHIKLVNMIYFDIFKNEETN